MSKYVKTNLEAEYEEKVNQTYYTNKTFVSAIICNVAF